MLRGELGRRKELSIFDLACGNLRFEAFLAAALPETELAFYAVDNCEALVPAGHSAHFQCLDVLGILHGGQRLNDQVKAPACDLSVSFGFMHHVPTAEYREEVLRTLIRKTRPAGYIIVSFWQFMKDAGLAKKAQATHAQALKDLGLPKLEEDDYLLGWKNIPGEYRYCHNFSEAEIDRLVASVEDEAMPISRFVADGRTRNLNTYLILQRLQ